MNILEKCRIGRKQGCVFSQTVVCSFISLVVSFDEQKCLILMKIQLISFVFHSYCSVSYEIFASQRCFLLEDLS